MRLEEWLRREGISDAEFGRRIGARSPSTVGRYKRGERVPNRRAMRAIMRETRGEVGPPDFYHDSADARA